MFSQKNSIQAVILKLCDLFISKNIMKRLGMPINWHLS